MEISPDQIELRKTYSKVSQILEKNFSDDERVELMAPSGMKSVFTIRETLDSFKDHIGDEHYSTLANGPAFATMLDQWLVDRRRDRIDGIWDRLSAKLPKSELSRITRRELEQFLIIFTSF
jgi:hypothetical protein